MHFVVFAANTKDPVCVSLFNSVLPVVSAILKISLVMNSDSLPRSVLFAPQTTVGCVKVAAACL